MDSRFSASRAPGLSNGLAAPAVTLLMALLLTAGCTRTTLKSSVADAHGDTDEFAEMDFWDGIAAAPIVTNHDALHALILSFGHKAGDFRSELALARKRAWVNEALAVNESARIGWIARAVCMETGIKGNLTMRMFGPRERYALIHLNNRRWLPNMSPEQAVSGAVLIALLSRAEDLQTGATDEIEEDA